MLRTQHALVVGLVVLTVFVMILKDPVPGSAAAPQPEAQMSPSPTPLQVTPPPRSTAISSSTPNYAEPQSQTPGWLQTLAGGILAWAAAGSIVLLLAAISLFLYVRRRRRHSFSPLPTTSIPFLKSADGSVYFRLDRLDGDGLIIGRGSHAVDLQLEESTPSIDTVSKRHARIYYDATYGNVIIEDLDSMNGIFINGRQAPRKNLLKDGWTVGLGSVTLKYHDGESDTGPLD
jgi:hypothetical protein